MNKGLHKGFTSLSALFITSLLFSLGGVGTAVAFQHTLPENFREELSKMLEKISHVDEISASVIAITPTPTPTGATGINGATGTSGATGSTGASGATGATEIEVTGTPTPKPTGTIDQDDDQNDDADDVNEDIHERILENNHSEQVTGATGVQVSVTGRVEE